MTKSKSITQFLDKLFGYTPNKQPAASVVEESKKLPKKDPLDDLNDEARAALKTVDDQISGLKAEQDWTSWEVILVQFTTRIESLFYLHHGQWLRLDEGRWYTLDEMRGVVSTAVLLEEHEIIFTHHEIKPKELVH